MLFPGLTAPTDVALFLPRRMIAAIFATSGRSHATPTKDRAESIGMSPASTLAPGISVRAGVPSRVPGAYPQAGAILLMGVTLGAVHRKVFVRKRGFRGDVILATGGGGIRLT